jgi:hypothetical protein
MPEIGMPRARRDDECVIAKRRAVFENDAPVARVHAFDLTEQSPNVLALGEERADRPGDLRWRQRRARDLIEQRLKKMVVAAIDKGDVNAAPREPLDGFEAVEARAHDHHAMATGGGVIAGRDFAHGRGCRRAHWNSALA